MNNNLLKERKMKIGLAIAPANASPSAFVVFREDLKVSIRKASELGYDGVELALASPEEINVTRVKDLIQRYNLELPVISTGRFFSEAKLWFTHPNEEIRGAVIQRIKDVVKIASQFKSNVNIGRVRGNIPKNEKETEVEKRFFSVMTQCAEFAANYGVELLLEPVNRYETNFINSVEEAVDIVEKLGKQNVKLMPDVFHMNIEDASILNSLWKAKHRISYVHFADSNRQAPGQGHLDFPRIISTLKDIGYDGFVTVEILPQPDPDIAAKMAIDYLRPLI